MQKPSGELWKRFCFPRVPILQLSDGDLQLVTRVLSDKSHRSLSRQGASPWLASSWHFIIILQYNTVVVLLMMYCIWIDMMIRVLADGTNSQLFPKYFNGRLPSGLWPIHLPHPIIPAQPLMPYSQIALALLTYSNICRHIQLCKQCTAYTAV